MTENTYVNTPRQSRSGSVPWLDAVQVTLQRLGFVAGARHVLVLPGHRTGVAGSTLAMTVFPQIIFIPLRILGFR